MTHTMQFPFYRVLGDAVEGYSRTTIKQAKDSFMEAYLQYWQDELEDEGTPTLNKARQQEGAMLVMAETEKGIYTAVNEHFSDHPDGVCFGDSGWVMTLPWGTKDAG